MKFVREEHYPGKPRKKKKKSQWNNATAPCGWMEAILSVHRVEAQNSKKTLWDSRQPRAQSVLIKLENVVEATSKKPGVGGLVIPPPLLGLFSSLC